VTARPRLPTHGASFVSGALPRPWRARVYLGGKHISLGYYATPEEAMAAHAEAVKRHLGEQFLRERG
jgi:hypothetical protein